MTATRNLILAALVAVALVLQVSVFSHLAWEGVVPNLALLVVVAGGLVHGAQFGAVLGFAAGLLADLAPPADHVAGRWALALLVAGYVAGRARQDVRPTWGSVMLTVLACSFVGSSVFALSGLVLRDAAVPVLEMLQVIGVGMAWDVLVASIAVPALVVLLHRLSPARAAW
ncbi:rod shape-determining protein MreD [Nocardioides daejeonensis]|uniref:rod shape-determining protein MreD n=1 Tax=Nocardioides daejeonensis TaxID=1046556 RepID=UPI00194DE1F9|nr:rod shape-determining protein MreD [Nocardioides daejeonensis]